MCSRLIMFKNLKNRFLVNFRIFLRFMSVFPINMKSKENFEKLPPECTNLLPEAALDVKDSSKSSTRNRVCTQYTTNANHCKTNIFKRYEKI